MKRLADLLTSMFSPQELRRLVYFEFSGLEHHLTHHTSLAALSHEVVELLARNGMLDDAFFDVLVRERPRRRDEIDLVRRQVMVAQHEPAAPDVSNAPATRSGGARIGRRELLGATGALAATAIAGGGGAGRGGRPAPDPEDLAKARSQRYRGLLFSAHTYGPAIPDLRSPPNDLVVVADALTQFGFEIETYDNATRGEILNALDTLVRPSSASQDDDETVVIYYAGHGSSGDHGVGHGAWQPADATQRSHTWIGMHDIIERMRLATARHLLLIADSCFGGVANRGGGQPSELMRVLASRRSRIALTSGADQPVADKGTHGVSFFAFHLARLLKQSGDYVLLGDLFPALREAVARDTQHHTKQTPEWGAVPGAGHGDGEPVLIRTVSST